MALFPCTECGKEISSDARSCPHCGKRDPLANPKGKRNFWLGIGAFFLILYAITEAMPPSDPASPSTSSGSSASLTSTPTSNTPAGPQLELGKYNWSQESESYVVMHGQVKNVTDTSLKNVAAVVTYYDKDGGFVTSDDAVIEYNPILAGQTSPFRVTTGWNPAMRTASVEFKRMFGGTISHREAK